MIQESNIVVRNKRKYFMFEFDWFKGLSNLLYLQRRLTAEFCPSKSATKLQWNEILRDSTKLIMPFPLFLTASCDSWFIVRLLLPHPEAGDCVSREGFYYFRATHVVAFFRRKVLYRGRCKLLRGKCMSMTVSFQFSDSKFSIAPLPVFKGNVTFVCLSLLELQQVDAHAQLPLKTLRYDEYSKSRSSDSNEV